MCPWICYAAMLLCCVCVPVRVSYQKAETQCNCWCQRVQKFKAAKNSPSTTKVLSAVAKAVAAPP